MTLRWGWKHGQAWSFPSQWANEKKTVRRLLKAPFLWPGSARDWDLLSQLQGTAEAIKEMLLLLLCTSGYMFVQIGKQKPRKISLSTKSLWRDIVITAPFSCWTLHSLQCSPMSLMRSRWAQKARSLLLTKLWSQSSHLPPVDLSFLISEAGTVMPPFKFGIRLLQYSRCAV